MAEVPAPASASARQSSWPIYLYVPNLIGYARILANATAFGVAFTNKDLFVTLYFISFVCDELDGRFARMLNQTSTFGAVLDMVTDRVSTAALLVLLTHFYKAWYGLFLGLLALDISSHWLQMYRCVLSLLCSSRSNLYLCCFLAHMKSDCHTLSQILTTGSSTCHHKYKQLVCCSYLCGVDSKLKVLRVGLQHILIKQDKS
jgi:phosphatidylglycerophosphate synthase